MTRAEMSYDEARNTQARCHCGLLVTNPQLCERARRCLLAGHPHAHPPLAVTWPQEPTQ